MKARKTKLRRKSNPEILLWRARRDLLIDVFGSVSKAASRVGCHPNALRHLDACPGKKKKLVTLLKEKGEVLP